LDRLIAISGPIGVGKSGFSQELETRYGFSRISTRRYLTDVLGAANERGALQAAGTRLDKENGGRWVADAARAQVGAAGGLWLLDAVRIRGQVDALREVFGDTLLHIHLYAAEEVLEMRYGNRNAGHDAGVPFKVARADPTEVQVAGLAAVADFVLDADNTTPAELADVAAALAGLPLEPREPLVDVIVGGQYGSEGKGNVCASIAHAYAGMIRVGGPNAGHVVADPYYKWVQLPSGTASNPEAVIMVAAGSTLWLPTLLREIVDHPDVPGRLLIDPNAMVIDDSDRHGEAGALGSISSTAQGVGFATARKILNRGEGPTFGPRVRLARDVKELAGWVRPVAPRIDELVRDGRRVLIEGTQGTALSLHHGQWPFVTSRETTAAGCLADSGIGPGLVRRMVMVVRTYPIRVGGASGPMGREVTFDEVARRSGLPVGDIARTEVGSVSGKTRRMAEFDWALLRRSSLLNRPTDIALTFADYLGAANRGAVTRADLSADTLKFIAQVEAVSGAKVSLVSKAKAGVLGSEVWS